MEVNNAIEEVAAHRPNVRRYYRYRDFIWPVLMEVNVENEKIVAHRPMSDEIIDIEIPSGLLGGSK